jgi:hypothetical protein
LSYGGHGFFGRLVVDDLLAATDFDVVVTGRAPRFLQSWDAERVTLATIDQHDHAAVRRALDGRAAFVHTAGPYQGLPPSVLRGALDAGVTYIDLADDRAFVQRAEALVASARSSSPVVLGMSFVPGLCALLVARVRGELGALERIRCVATPGSKGSRGHATLASLLSHAGRRFDVPRGGRPASVWGWSAPERVDFQPPIGQRTAYLAIPVADFDLFPRWFGCREVEFRACSDQPRLDRALWLAAGVQRAVAVPFLRYGGKSFARFVRVAGRFGTDAGAGLVELSSRTQQLRIAVGAHERAERLPALPAALAVAELLTGARARPTGLVAPHELVQPAAFIAALATRGITTWVDRGAGWTLVRTN